MATSEKPAAHKWLGFYHTPYLGRLNLKWQPTSIIFDCSTFVMIMCQPLAISHFLLSVSFIHINSVYKFCFNIFLVIKMGVILKVTCMLDCTHVVSRMRDRSPVNPALLYLH